MPPELPLARYEDERYQVSYPRDWQVMPGITPEERLFTPPDDLQAGVLVRVVGMGYSFSVLDALVNSEVESMRREGLAPEEVGVRRSEEFSGDQLAGRTAMFRAQINGVPVRLQVTALVANFTGAYVIRAWAAEAEFEAGGYAGAFARIVRDFTPLFRQEAAPTDVPALPTTTPAPAQTQAVPTPMTPSADEEAPATAAVPVLGDEPYHSESFVMTYPLDWSPTVNLDGTVNFLSADPNELVGISVRPLLGASYEPEAAADLLEAYLAEVMEEVPGVAIGDQRVEEQVDDRARGLSATYVVPYEGGRLVYRATMLVSLAVDGTAYRIVQWTPEPLYEAGYRDLYRAVIAGFRPVPAELPQGENP